MLGLEPPAMLTVPEVCRVLRISERTGRQLITDGKFPVPVVLIGRRRRIRRADLEAYIAGMETTEAVS